MAGQTLFLTVDEAGIELRIGKSTTWRLIKSGELPSVKVGGSRRVRRTDLEEYARSLVPSLPEPREAA